MSKIKYATIVSLFCFMGMHYAVKPSPKKAMKTFDTDSVYLFSSFKEPATDGLRYLYSLDGFKWDSLPGTWLKPTVGNQSKYFDYKTQQWAEPNHFGKPLMRDPSIVKGPDGLYHMVWTVSWWGDKSFAYASSKDLINWSEQRLIPVMKDSATFNVWAPEVFYDNAKKQYIIAWSSSIHPDRYTEEDKKGINTCHRIYYSTTKDFVSFSKAGILYDPGFNSIDGFFVRKATNDYVLILKDNRKPGYSDLFAAFASQPEGPYQSQKIKFGPTYSEGPACLKINNEWIIYFDIYREKRYGAVKTQDFITFTDISATISMPAGVRHGSMIKISKDIFEKLKRVSKQKYL